MAPRPMTEDGSVGRPKRSKISTNCRSLERRLVLYAASHWCVKDEWSVQKLPLSKWMPSPRMEITSWHEAGWYCRDVRYSAAHPGQAQAEANWL